MKLSLGSIVSTSLLVALPYSTAFAQVPPAGGAADLTQLKQEATANLDTRINFLTEAKNCVNAAQTKEDLKKCRTELKEDRSELKAANESKREERKKAREERRAARKGGGAEATPPPAQ